MRWAPLFAGSFLLSFGIGRWIREPGSNPNVPGAVPVIAGPSAAVSGKNVESSLRTFTSENTPVNLAQVLAINDPLASAAHALAWIESATLEDFRKLADEPDTFPVYGPESGFKRECRKAFQDALFNRWFELDEKGALAAALHLDSVLNGTRTLHGEVATSVARVRPKLLLEHFLAKDGINILSTPIETAFETLAATDSAAARAMLLQIAEGDSRRSAEVVVERRLAAIDPLAGVAAAKRLRHSSIFREALEAAKKQGPGMLREVIASIGSEYDTEAYLAWIVLKEPATAAELAGLKRIRTSDAGMISLTDQMTPDDRERFLAGYEKLPENIRADAGAAMASAWARTNPGAAAKWALSYARPQERTHVENRAVKNVFLRWINNTPDEALAWWRMLPASPLRDDLGASASTYIAEGGALDLALEMVEPAAGHADPDLLGQMGQLLAARSPDEAATWLTSLPEEADTKIAAKLVVQAMYRKQPSSAAEFLTRLPRGEGRDRMITGFIEQAALQSPVEAAEWVTLIDDPHSRRDAASVIYLQWRERSPAAAQEWIRTLTGVDPEWHARFLRTMR